MKKTLETKDTMAPKNTSKININDLLVWLVQLTTLKTIMLIKTSKIIKFQIIVFINITNPNGAQIAPIKTKLKFKNPL